MSTPLFRFKGRYASCDPEGYYYTRFTKTWLVQTPQGNLIVRGWPEAMFLAQLLAAPHDYIRAAGR